MKQIVDICVACMCFNHEAFLVESLESVLNQSVQPKQVLIIDDCSTDGSVELIKAWLSKHNLDWELIGHSENRGLNKSLNEALAQCEQPYFQILATDDVLASDKLEKQYHLMQSRPEIAVCCGNYSSINERGELVQQQYFPDDYAFPDDVFAGILHGHEQLPIVVHSPTTLSRHECLLKVGGYPEDLLQEDFYMWLRLSLSEKFYFEPSILVKYRVLSTSLSSQLNKEKRSRYLMDHIGVLERLQPLANTSQLTEIYKALKVRWIKFSQVAFKHASPSEMDETLQGIIKRIAQYKKENAFEYNAVLSRLYLNAWRSGKQLQWTDWQYLKGIPFYKKMLMVSGIPYKIKEAV